MELRFDPRVQDDIRNVVTFYRERSEEALDRFYAELRRAMDRIRTHPERHHVSTPPLRRCNLRRFPYHMLFEIRGGVAMVFVLKHHKRHPLFGTRRRHRIP